jgi:hypothetical protein
MTTLKMPEMQGGQVQEEFLVTANKLHETWATADLPSITTLVASFRQFLRIVKPQGSTFGTFGASLGIAEGNGPNSKENTTEGNSQDHKPQGRTHGKGRYTPKCICDKIHWYKNCLYVNPVVRPQGWKPDSKVEAKFEKARKNPKIAERLQRAAETPGSTQPTTSPLLFDAQPNGDQQPHSMACSLQVFSTNHVPAPPYINRWIIDPRSNVHVINNSKAWRWTHTRYGAAYETLFAGAQAVPISE